MARRRLQRLVRIGLWSLLGLVVLVIGGGVVVALSFDPDSLKPRIAAAVKQATGRDLTLQGRIRLALSLRPTLTVQGVSFANPPGFSRPLMATLERLDVQLALLPLLSHRVEIDRLELVKPDIILETDAQGRPNWQFTPEARPAGPASGAAGTQDQAATRFSLADVRIEDGTLTWHDGRVGRSAVIGIRSLQASAPSPDADLQVSLSAVYDGTPFSVTGKFGPLARLRDRASSAAWPVQAQLEAVGAKLAVNGTVSQPLQARGYQMKLDANVPDVAALAPLLPGVRLPALHDVTLAAQVTDTGAPLPELSGLTLHVGQSDLTAAVAGLRLDRLDVAAPRLDQPVKVSAQGNFNNSPATVRGSLGAPVGLLSGANAVAPIPFDLDMQALGSSLAVKGTAARRQDGRPSVQAEVAADTIDLDSLLAALPRPPPPAPAATAPAAAAATPPAPAHVIPDTPIRFDLLHLADADVKLSAAQLIWRGATYRAVATNLALHGGKLRLDPLSADLPAGHLDAMFSADASEATPIIALRLQVPALAVADLLAAVKEPGYAAGNLEVQADLRGSGTTPHAIAASLDGSVGLALANGTLDNRIIGSALGAIVHETNLLDLVGRGGTSQVQCFAARLDAIRGVATLRSLVFASSLLTIDGNGSLNLGAEMLDLHLRPQARLAGTGIILPLRVSGSFRKPSTVSDTAALVTGNAASIAQGKTPLGMVMGALGGKQLLTGANVDCGAALAVARGTPASAAPMDQAAHPTPGQQPRPPDVGSLLKQLLR